MKNDLIKVIDHGCDGRSTGVVVGYYWIPREFSLANINDIPGNKYWERRAEMVQAIQTYVLVFYGEDISWYVIEMVHPDKIPDLMDGWIRECDRLMRLINFNTIEND